MNANSKPKTSRISYWLRDAAEQLADVGISSALLDAEIILAHTLKKSRTYLHAHGEEEISARLMDIANARLDLRLDRTPVAYLIGHKEFYGRTFKVTPATLIPRPESETIIQLLDEHVDLAPRRLLDIGTGSGCLGITAKLEFQNLDVTISDIDKHALTVATDNAKQLGADVTIIRSDLFANTPGLFDYILANLPYVDREWERSPETNFEPELALFASHGGLMLVNRLLDDLPFKLSSRGIAFIEADPEQHPSIISRAETIGLQHLATRDYIIALQQSD